MENKKMITEVRENELFFAKVNPNAIIPTKRDEDAGFDVYCADRTKTIVIEPCSVKMIETGIAIACNKAYFPKFFDKGGMGSKGIIVGAGVGDSGYRDGYFVPLINTNKYKYLILTTQSNEEIEKCNCFDTAKNQFIHLENYEVVEEMSIPKADCIIKPISKAVVQFVMIPVPSLKVKELSYEDLKNIKSERGLGKLGSSGK